jgi:hypothetical protein
MLFSDRKTVLVNGTCWHGVLGDVAVTCYGVKIKVHGNGATLVGLASKDPFKVEKISYKNSYFIYLYDGSLYGPDVFGKKYFKAINSSSIIQINYNKQTNEIRFIVDDEDCGVAFYNVTGELYPIVRSVDTYCILTLI